MIHTTHVNNRRKLQAELQLFSALKERPNASNWEPEAKRARTGEIKCYRCGKQATKSKTVDLDPRFRQLEGSGGQGSPVTKGQT